MIEHDYYKLMELETGADFQVLKKRYRELALMYHPDKNPNNRLAEEYFKVITQGYNLLNDAGEKEIYDRLLKAYYADKSRPVNKQKAKDEEVRQKVRRHRERKRLDFIDEYVQAENAFPHRYRFVFALLLYASGVLICYNHWYINLLNYKLFYVIAGSFMFGTGAYLLAENVYRRRSFKKAMRIEEYTTDTGPVRLFVKLFFITPVVFLLVIAISREIHLTYFYTYVPVKKVMFLNEDVEYLYEVNGEDILRRCGRRSDFPDADKSYYRVKFSRINPYISELVDLRKQEH